MQEAPAPSARDLYLREDFVRKVNLAANFYILLICLRIFNGTERIVRTFAVTMSPRVPSPRVTPCQQPVRKDQRNAETIDLQLSDIIELAPARHSARPRIPLASSSRL